MTDLLTDGPPGPALSATSDAPSTKPQPPALSATAPGQTETPAKPEEKPQTESPKDEKVEEPESQSDEGTESDAEPESEEKPEQIDQAKTEQPPKGVRKRIDELTAARKQAEKATEEERTERRAAQQRADETARALQQALDLIKGKEQAAQAEQAAPKPNRDEFTNPDDWERSLVEWSAKETVRQHQIRARSEAEQAAHKAAQDAAESAQRATREAWERKTKEAKTKYPDFEDVAFKQPNEGGPNIDHVMTQTIAQIESGTDVAYWLGKNVKESHRIASLPPIQQVIELTRIAERIKDKPATTKTPAPMKPVGARSNAGPKHPNEMSMDELAAHLKEQAKANNRRR